MLIDSFVSLRNINHNKALALRAVFLLLGLSFNLKTLFRKAFFDFPGPNRCLGIVVVANQKIVIKLEAQRLKLISHAVWSQYNKVFRVRDFLRLLAFVTYF